VTRHRHLGVWLVALVGVAVLAFVAARSANDGGTAVTTTATSEAAAVQADIGFRSQRRLDEHFEKHGREFGDIDKQTYLRRAQELRDRAAGGPVLEVVRDDGVVTRFDRETGGFIAFNPDRTIRTFFRPNDGEDYFRRQARR
jgi:pyocin large subunit-like protein